MKISSRNKYLAFAILVGGRSIRFGADKGLFKFRGKPLIEYQLEVLKEFKYDVFLVANSKQQTQSYINQIDIRDITGFIIDDYDFNLDTNIRSPMIGLYSAFKELKELKYEKLFALSCDNPLIKKEVINFLIQEAKSYDCCIPQWLNKFTEPLFAIYPVIKAYETSLSSIQRREFKLTNIISQEWKTNYVSIEENIVKLDPLLLTFKNMNSFDDIKTLENELC